MKGARGRTSTLWLSTILLMAHGISAASDTPGFEEVWASIGQAHEEALAETGVVGGSLAFVHRGKIVGQNLHGFADLESERIVDLETIYHWASITKTLTGIAILQLRDRGLLDLDSSLTDYLPELRQMHNPHGDMDDITVSQVLSHSAGFRMATWPWGGAREWHPFEPHRWEQLVAMFPYSEIHFEPGSKYLYSNPAIIFLGRIIELVTGDDYEVYIDKNILKPLGMYRSYFDVTPYHLEPYRSSNYKLFMGKPRPGRREFDTGITAPNGGFNAPITDLVKFVGFLAGDPDRSATHEGILSRESLEEMWQKRYEVSEVGPLKSSMGWIFFLEEQNGRRFVGHTGYQQNFVAFVYVRPESQTGAIFAVNSFGHDTEKLMKDLRGRLFDEVFSLFEP